MELNEVFIKLMIAQEVTNQMNPLREDVQDIRKNLRSFYSNGSGGPPGALEIWREEDKKRFEGLERGALVAEANNDTFLKFIARYDAQQAHRQKRQRQIIGVLKWAAPLIGSGLLTLAGVIYQSTSPVIHALWSDYLHAHPHVHEELQRQ